MKLFKNQKGFNDVITVTLIGGILGSLFILGVFVWKEVELVNTTNRVNQLVSKVVDVKNNEKVENKKNNEWLVYNNEESGISFNYPAEFIRGDSSEWLGELFKLETGHFWFKVEDSRNLNTPQEIRDDYYANDTYGYQYEDSFINIGSLNLYKQGRYDLGVIEKYSFINNNKLVSINFEFNFSDESQKLQNKYKNLISNILESFKFLDGGNEDNRFISRDGRLELQYLPDWTCKEVVYGERVDCFPEERQIEEYDAGFEELIVPYANIHIFIMNCEALEKDLILEGLSFYNGVKSYGNCSVIVSSDDETIDNELKVDDIIF